MRRQHPIFNRPLDPKLRLDPAHQWAEEYDSSGTWLVQEGVPGKTVDYGLVATGQGLEDSPDAERISGGVNSKGPHAVAIGRQANMMLWGFYAGPDKMTASARRVFLNAIVYMRRFDGRRPLVKQQAQARAWLRHHAEKLAGKTSAGVRKYLLGRFPAAADAGNREPAALREWVDANLDFIYAAGRRNLLLDKELQALGIPNNSPQLLSWLSDTLAKNPNDPRALSLARRYLPESATGSAAAVLRYIREGGDKLFFSDQGGYRWFRDTRQPLRRRY